jgi:hypothetical protein
MSKSAEATMVNLKNPYRGVNAHLNSELQSRDSWADFDMMLAHVHNK